MTTLQQYIGSNAYGLYARCSTVEYHLSHMSLKQHLLAQGIEAC